MDRSRGIQRIIKRLIDLIISFISLLVLGMPMCILALLIKLESRGPALFKQERTGEEGVQFTLYKFRSMREVSEKEGVFHNAERVTPIGRLIRKWRIDELPQLANVLKGDMSIVGPRPTLPYQVERYDEEQRRRLEVRPGITGWSQIHGDEAISWPERIEQDIWYIDNWSLWLDAKIMFATPFALLRIRKVNVEEGPPPDVLSEVTTEEQRKSGPESAGENLQAQSCLGRDCDGRA